MSLYQKREHRFFPIIRNKSWWYLMSAFSVYGSGVVCSLSLRKHAYSNIYKISPPKTENFQIKNSDIFHISAQNIDCGYSLEPPRQGGSNEYPQSMFWAEIRKKYVYPWKPQFNCIEVVFKGSKSYRHVFVMVVCWALWLLAAEIFSSFGMLVLLLCLVDPV